MTGVQSKLPRRFFSASSPMADNIVDGVIVSAARRSSRRAGRSAEKRPLERGRELLDGFDQLAVRARTPVHRPRTPVSSATSYERGRIVALLKAAVVHRSPARRGAIGCLRELQAATSRHLNSRHFSLQRSAPRFRSLR